MTRGMSGPEALRAARVAERVSRALSELDAAKLDQDATVSDLVGAGIGIGEVARSQGIAAQTAYRAMARHRDRAGVLSGQMVLGDPADGADREPVSGASQRRRRGGGDGATRRL